MAVSTRLRRIDEDAYRLLFRDRVARGFPFCPCGDCTRTVKAMPDWEDLRGEAAWATHPYGYDSVGTRPGG